MAWCGVMRWRVTHPTQTLPRGVQPLLHRPSHGRAPGHDCRLESCHELKLVVAGNIASPGALSSTWSPPGLLVQHLLQAVDAVHAARDKRRLLPKVGLPEVGIKLHVRVALVKRLDQRVDRVCVKVALVVGEVRLHLAPRGRGHATGVALVRERPVDLPADKLHEGPPLARALEPPLEDPGRALGERGVRPVAPRPLLFVLAVVVADVGVVVVPSVEAVVHQVHIHVANELDVRATVGAWHLQRAWREQLDEVLQDPRPALGEEAMAEALRVHRLQLESLGLEVLLAALANGELGRDLVVDGSLQASPLPDPVPTKSETDSHPALVRETKRNGLGEAAHNVGHERDRDRHRVAEKLVLVPNHRADSKDAQHHPVRMERAHEEELVREAHHVD